MAKLCGIPENKLDRINIFKFIELWNDEINQLDKSRIKVKFLNNDFVNESARNEINLKGLTGEIVKVIDYFHETDHNYILLEIELDKIIESLNDYDNKIIIESIHPKEKDIKVRIYRNDRFTYLFGKFPY